jgi:hypothetical protein
MTTNQTGLETTGPQRYREGISLSAMSRGAMMDNPSLAIKADEMAIRGCAMNMERLKGTAAYNNMEALNNWRWALNRDIANANAATISSGSTNKYSTGTISSGHTNDGRTSNHLQSSKILSSIALAQQLSAQVRDVVATNLPRG